MSSNPKEVMEVCLMYLLCHSSSGFCTGLFTCLEESTSCVCVCMHVIVCDLETLTGPRADFGFGATRK